MDFVPTRGQVILDDAQLRLRTTGAVTRLTDLFALKADESTVTTRFADRPTAAEVAAQITAAINTLKGDAGPLMDTLGEISDALQDDHDVYNTLLAFINAKQAFTNFELNRGELLLCGDPNFGEVSFSLSCRYDLRETFDLGLTLIHSFEYAEAEKAFGNSGVYIEKFIENPRHIEYQILGDGRGKIIHLGERDCSIQRRNQKLIEETPSPFLDLKQFRDLRKKMSRAAVKIGEAAKYTNAGTVEFVVDEKGKFYFLEVKLCVKSDFFRNFFLLVI